MCSPGGTATVIDQWPAGGYWLNRLWHLRLLFRNRNTPLPSGRGRPERLILPGPPTSTATTFPSVRRRLDKKCRASTSINERPELPDAPFRLLWQSFPDVDIELINMLTTRPIQPVLFFQISHRRKPFYQYRLRTRLVFFEIPGKTTIRCGTTDPPYVTTLTD